MLLRSESLVKIYKKRTVVNNVSIQVAQGEIVGLLGPNGAGKTTTFYMTVGLIKPNSGKIFLDEQDITDLPMYKRAQSGIGYLAQEASVFRKLSVEDNIKAVLEMTKLSKEEQDAKTEELLTEFGLQKIRKSRGDLLSGGERRRTEIARALAVSPKFILLDEPFAGVDPIAVEDIQSIVAKLKEKNIGILITDHKPRETLSITDITYIINKGKILRHGNTKELVEDEEVRKLYLGEKFFMPEVQSTEEFLRHDRHELVKKRIEEKSYADATRLLTEMIGLNSTETVLYFQRAQCFWHMKDIPSARLDIERCLSDNPEHKEAQKFLRKYLVHNA